MNRAHWLILGLAAFLFLEVGCGNSQAVLKNDLKSTGMAYHIYHDANKKGPANWDDFIAFAKSSAADADAIQRVRDAGYELKWNVKLSEVQGGMANTVLGEKPGGGPKIMMDGSVQ